LEPGKAVSATSGELHHRVDQDTLDFREMLQLTSVNSGSRLMVRKPCTGNETMRLDASVSLRPAIPEAMQT